MEYIFITILFILFILEIYEKNMWKKRSQSAEIAFKDLCKKHRLANLHLENYKEELEKITGEQKRIF